MSDASDMTNVDWLLDADPSIRWQVMRDLGDDPGDVVAAERSRVAFEGWGARLLGLQGPDGQWGGGTYHPYWTSTTYTLLLLRDLGVEPTSDQAQKAVALVRDNLTLDDSVDQFFTGETETCVNAMVVALGSYFNVLSERPLGRLLDEQLDDGGWNCWAPEESSRSSFHTTICALEALWECEQAGLDVEGVGEARARGEEYLLERRMYRSLSTGEVIDPEWTLFSFPTRWHYDVLRGLDHFRATGADPDHRVSEALDLVERKRGDDGRWALENTHAGQIHFQIDGGDGRPSRWNTLRALRVLRWSGRS